jgi:hypothetical protein
VGQVLPVGFPLYDGACITCVNERTCFDSYTRSVWLIVVGSLWVEFPRLLLAVVAGYFLSRQVLPLSLLERDLNNNF